MSAAEPADPARPYVNTGATGAVIDITKRSRRGSAAQAAQGRWNSMATSPPPPHGPGPGPRPAGALEQYANTIETVFNGLKPPRTLTDEETAVVFLTTLEIVTRLLQGSQAQGIIDEQQLTKLDQLMDGLRHAPDLV